MYWKNKSHFLSSIHSNKPKNHDMNEIVLVFENSNLFSIPMLISFHSFPHQHFEIEISNHKNHEIKEVSLKHMSHDTKPSQLSPFIKTELLSRIVIQHRSAMRCDVIMQDFHRTALRVFYNCLWFLRCDAVYSRPKSYSYTSS